MRFLPWDCDFPSYIVQNNEKSQYLHFVLLSGVVGGSLVISFIILFFLRSKKNFEIS